MEPTAFLFLLSPGPEGGVQGCHLVVLPPGVGLDGRAVPWASRGQSGAAGPSGKVSPPGGPGHPPIFFDKCSFW